MPNVSEIVSLPDISYGYFEKSVGYFLLLIFPVYYLIYRATKAQISTNFITVHIHKCIHIGYIGAYAGIVLLIVDTQNYPPAINKKFLINMYIVISIAAVVPFVISVIQLVVKCFENAKKKEKCPPFFFEFNSFATWHMRANFVITCFMMLSTLPYFVIYCKVKRAKAQLTSRIGNPENYFLYVIAMIFAQLISLVYIFIRTSDLIRYNETRIFFANVLFGISIFPVIEMSFIIFNVKNVINLPDFEFLRGISSRVAPRAPGSQVQNVGNAPGISSIFIT